MAGAAIPDRGPLVVSLLAFLRTVTGMPGDVGEAPEEALGAEPEVPFFIVYPNGGEDFSGSPFHWPESMAGYGFLVAGVGETEAQAMWASDKIRKAFLDRTAAGHFTHTWADPAGLAILDRAPQGPPAPPEPDGTLWSITDAYVVRVEAQS